LSHCVTVDRLRHIDRARGTGLLARNIPSYNDPLPSRPRHRERPASSWSGSPFLPRSPPHPPSNSFFIATSNLPAKSNDEAISPKRPAGCSCFRRRSDRHEINGPAAGHRTEAAAASPNELPARGHPKLRSSGNRRRLRRRSPHLRPAAAAAGEYASIAPP